jgi:hypothetical protein
MLDQLGEGQRLTRTVQARIRLRGRPGNELDKVVIYASLTFRRGLGAKRSSIIKNAQRRRASCTIETETHGDKSKVRHLVRHHRLSSGYLGRKSNPLLRFTDGGAGTGTITLCARQSKLRRRECRVQSHQLRTAPCLAVPCRDLGSAYPHKQVRRPLCAVGDQCTGFIVRIETCNRNDPAADHLCKGVVAMEVMEARELVRASGKCMMPIHIKLQVTIGAHSPSFVPRAWRYRFSWVGNTSAFACKRADGHPSSTACLYQRHPEVFASKLVL